MLFDPKREDSLGRLEGRLRCAAAITPELTSTVITEACTRFAALRPSVKARVDQLIAFGAWTEATLALVEFELPQWKLRRLVYEDGEWLCSLSKQPRLPLGLDEVAEASHEVLPLAVLLAFIQALRIVAATPSANAVSTTTVPQASPFARLCNVL